MYPSVVFSYVSLPGSWACFTGLLSQHAQEEDYFVLLLSAIIAFFASSVIEHVKQPRAHLNPQIIEGKQAEHYHPARGGLRTTCLIFPACKLN